MLIDTVADKHTKPNSGPHILGKIVICQKLKTSHQVSDSKLLKCPKNLSCVQDCDSGNLDLNELKLPYSLEDHHLSFLTF